MRRRPGILLVLALAVGAVLGTATVAAALCSVATGDFDFHNSGANTAANYTVGAALLDGGFGTDEC